MPQLHCVLGRCNETKKASTSQHPVAPPRSISISLPLVALSLCHIRKRNYAGFCEAVLFFISCCWISPGPFIFIKADTFSKDSPESFSEFWDIRLSWFCLTQVLGERGADAAILGKDSRTGWFSRGRSGACLYSGLPFKRDKKATSLANYIWCNYLARLSYTEQTVNSISN